MKRLSIQQREMLERAVELVDRHGADGVFPSGVGQRTTVKALERKGLLKYVGIGRNIDGDGSCEVDIWGPTDAGRAWLADREVPETGSGS